MPDRRTALRELLQPHAEALVRASVALALKGDARMLCACLDRLVPSLRAVAAPITPVELTTGTLADQARRVIGAMAGGELSPDDGASLMQAIRGAAHVVEISAVETRLQELEEEVRRLCNASQTERARSTLASVQSLVNYRR